MCSECDWCAQFYLMLVTLGMGGILVWDLVPWIRNKCRIWKDTKRKREKEKEAAERKRRREARKILLKSCCIGHNDLGAIDPVSLQGLRTVGGLDVSYHKHSNAAFATLAVLEFPAMRLLASSTVQVTIGDGEKQKYVPGFLADRECEAFKTVFRRFEEEHPTLVPQVIVVDGNGYLHPNRFGSASQIGVELQIPTIGIAKNLMRVDNIDVDEVGEDTRDSETVSYPLWSDELWRRGPAFVPTRASRDAILWRLPAGGAEGFVVKPYKSVAIWGGNRRENGMDLLGYSLLVDPGTQRCKPIFVSKGHRTDADFAKFLTIACSIHRVPEPVRQADLISRRFVREHEH